MIKNYHSFHPRQRPQVIEVLVSRPSFAEELLAVVAAGSIPVNDLTAFDVRQIRSLNDPELIGRVSELWGEVRESPAEKREQIHTLKSRIGRQIFGASLSKGRALFNDSCSKYHRLFGQGDPIGPDLTGSNRNNLDYLLGNIIDPSAIVSKDFRMTVVVTVDGRVLNGLVTAETEKTLTLQTQTDRKTIDRDEIEEVRSTSQSPMPEGILDNLSGNQIHDLIAYLMNPIQVPLPDETQEQP